MVECPHCFTLVIAKADGACPACGRNVNERSGTDAGKTAVTLKPVQPLPRLCTSCGTYTELRERISRSIQVGSQEVSFSKASLLHAFFRWALKVDRRYVIIDLPLCATCGVSRIQLVHVDFENFAMTFVVDRAFRDALIKTT